MSSPSMSLKARINNYAKKHGIAAQVVLQNYMFERFLERLSKSEYKEKFVIKGGLLIATIVGLDIRSTMDLDTTLRNLVFTEEQITQTIQSICSVDLGDEINFTVVSVTPIRKDNRYGGFSVRMDAGYDGIRTPLSIDISTGDVLTPSAVHYEFDGMFDESVHISIWGYNIETVMAEKMETILSRGIFSTRPRDYYDIYILSTTQTYDKALFWEALLATANHRESQAVLANKEGIFKNISESRDLRERWTKYQRKFPYAQNITYDEVIEILHSLLSTLPS
ncbi:MAG: nucleotidyl transferase AbiEii/AbiGii toxin family protein [Candidatus Cloacimonetes bacterium]|uniref:nucleotidyl transferase AbiEii/AbiGii toxin family protein n=1 Tax=Sphaerochaeta sp. TaxID=1972642 RepID=UPI000A7213EE|nr:nucleotidyl transferase AbiEii/AbiGii toxin family protein [Sphaerochaeta sp.]MDD3524520.1 nucleotidyl transferase AbiEii/AbiGii toxin family protein [Candidatus Cloacimonadota bacterium]MDX9825769.1 nucleotidyl transferase AbiEii/AbiGii toxin family protein [Sphaerochaeta sp.]